MKNITESIKGILFGRTVGKTLILSFDAKATEAIEEIAARSNHTTAGVVQRGVALYDVATKHAERGGKLIFRSADGKEEELKP